ncbi:class I SAM-dependent methyltransferase [Yoonia sp.]|uniref:class I SAM-dependent methyltransferase n=1 Tax=Yoonia sp. TaxID=2212373 RepID=UPI002E001BDB|nr:class I SAM-dependent methyltransferase [Yoonia sp.]
MTTWTSGYVADLDYTHGFYRELTPELIRFVALAKGVQTRTSITYCELGCGQGFSANIIAAANPHVQVYANDFNPVQVSGANVLASEAGASNAHFFDHAFEEFAAEPSLPDQFDVIALHGIYSWISPQNRQHIVDFVKRKLKVSGLLYISYNTLPGWAAAMPLRRLMVDHAGTTAGPVTTRVEAAISFTEKVIAAQPAYFAQSPTVGPRFEKFKGMSRNYLAHEYFNRDWTPFYFGDVVAELSEAKLTFVGSANLLDHIDAVNLSEEQQKLLAESGDPIRREGLRDYMINQQFRRDVFIKGVLSHSVMSAREAWLEMRFALSTLRADVPLTVTGARGEANLQADVYGPILDAFAQGPVSVRQALSDQKIADLGWAKLMQALAVLVGSGHLQPCLSSKEEGKRRERTKAFNMAVCNRAKSSADLSFLASPVTGGGIQVDRFQQLFLLARAQKESDPATFVWNILKAQDQRLIRDGKPLDSPDDNIAELKERLSVFDEKRLPVLKQLGIA